MFKSVGKDYNNYKETINNYNSVFKSIAAWMLARDSNEFAINDIVSHLTEYINRKKLNSANIKVSIANITINDKSIPDFINYPAHVYKVNFGDDLSIDFEIYTKGQERIYKY